MIYEIILIAPALWVMSIILSLCFLRILEGKKLSFSQLVDNELFILILICVFAPATFLLLLLSVAVKAGVGIANIVSLEENCVKGCSTCSHRLYNECLFYRLNIRPKMLCKGRFFNKVSI